MDTGVKPSFSHVGAVVEDVNKTTEFLSSMLGFGPWQSLEYSPRKDELTAGEPFVVKFSFARLGPTLLELIQPLEGRSIFSQFLETKGEGLHHIAFSIPNWEETALKFQEQRGRMVAGGVCNGKRWGYSDTNPGGIIVGFEEKSDEGKPLFCPKMPSDMGAIAPPSPTHPSPTHVSPVIENRDRTVELLSSIFGLSPWLLKDFSFNTGGIVEFQFQKGERIVQEPFSERAGRAKLGPIRVHLVQPLEGMSVYSEFLKTKGEGLHHRAFTHLGIPYWEEAVSGILQQGGSRVAGGDAFGKRWGYYETEPGGIILELVESEEEEEEAEEGITEGIYEP